MYYIEVDKNIVIYGKDLKKINNTLEFLPQYKDCAILETDKNIVEFDGKFYFEDDNQYIENKNLRERQKIDNLSLTKREVFLALYKAKGLTPDVLREKITDKADLIEFDYASEYIRGNELVNKIGRALEIAPEDLDYLFINKKLP